MAKKAKANRRLTEELLETAQDMRAGGLMSKAAHEKIVKQHSTNERRGEPKKALGLNRPRPPTIRQKRLD
jgi:hypothetical protein